MSVPSFDVAVIGGGPAGAAAALTLASAGRRVVLLERRSVTGPTGGEALPPAARPLLRELGALDALAADGHLPSYGTASAWGSDAPRFTDFIRHPYGPGWHLDRARFDERLRTLAAEAGAEVRVGTALAAAMRRPNGWRLAVSPGAIEARWLIDASGRASIFARGQGVRRRSVDRLVASVARLGPPAGGDAPDTLAVTEIAATPGGWWYTAPLPDRGRVLACLTDAGTDAARLARSAEGLRQLLGGVGRIGPRLAAHGFTLDAPPLLAAAATSRIERFSGDGWLAVGDAALACDPLLGQGLLSALYGGIHAGRVLDRHLGGDPAALEGYAARLEDLYAAHLRGRAECYAAERRWPDSPFWRQRQEAAG